MEIQSAKSRLILVPLIGAITMFFGEALILSSPLWFIDVWSILVTFPHYLMHLLFLLNIAMKSKRTSIPQLYLLGDIFALYESWVTKVLWYGYPGDEAIWGVYAGIAIFEFLTLVFFYHPIFSFIVPIMILQLLSYHKYEDESLLLDNHLLYFMKSRNSNLFILFLLILFPGIFLGALFGATIYVSWLTISVSWLIIYLLYRLETRRDKSRGTVLSIRDLHFGRRGFSLIFLYLLIFYVLTYIGLEADKIPTDPVAFIVILLSYAIVILLFIASKKIEIYDEPVNKEIYGLSSLKKYLISLVLIPLPFIVLGGLSGLLFLLINVIGILWGVSYFLNVTFGVITGKY